MWRFDPYLNITFAINVVISYPDKVKVIDVIERIQAVISAHNGVIVGMVSDVCYGAIRNIVVKHKGTAHRDDGVESDENVSIITAFNI